MKERMLRTLVRTVIRFHPEGVPGAERSDMEKTFFDKYLSRQDCLDRPSGFLSNGLFLTREIWSLLWHGLALRFETRRRPRLLRGFIDDLRFAARSLIKNPLFAVGAILILALGIGINNAIFSVNTGMSRIVQRFQDPDELAFLWGVEEGWDTAPVSGLDYLEWRASASAFREMGIHSSTYRYITGGGEPQRVRAVRASANLLPMLGLRTEIGRLFGPADADPSAPAVVVLSHWLWMERYGGEVSVLGQTISMNDAPHTVIGVLPETVDFEMLWREAGVFMPLIESPAEWSWDNRPYRVIGRLAEGASIEQAQTQLSAIAARLAESQPETNAEVRARVEPFGEFFYSGDDKLATALLMAAVIAVLLIACVNLANILLAKGTARQGEIAIRQALGASRWRMVRQLLAESFFLSFCGGVAGIFLGLYGMKLLMTSFASQPFLPEEVGLDGALLAFTVMLSVAAALSFGLAPALLSTRVSLAEGVKESIAGASSGQSRKRFRNWILVVQLALTVPLVITCAIAYLNVRALRSVDVGFSMDGLVTLQADLPYYRYQDQAQQSAFFRDVVEAVRGAPGIESVGAGTSFPMGAGRYSAYGPMIAQGREELEGRARGPSTFQSITPEYFGTLGVSLQSGRNFTLGDGAADAPVAIVNEAFVRFYWPGEEALGKQLTPLPVEWDEDRPLEPVTVVGVVADFGVTLYGEPPAASVYRPNAQAPTTSMVLVARTSADPSIVFPEIREAVQRVDAGVPLSLFRTSKGIKDTWLQETRVIAATLGLLGILALGLAVVGLYGMVAYSVAQRTYELGVRMVLGADRGAVRLAVMRSFVKLSTIGLAVGLVISIATAAAMRSQLVMLQVSWIPSVLGIVVLLTLVVMMASYLPARRATTIEPAVALRCE